MPTPPTPPTPRPFISVIQGRHPEQKSHANIGQAKNAVIQSTKPGTMVWRGDDWRNGSVPFDDRDRYIAPSQVEECIDGIFTGRKKYTGHQICGGQIWKVAPDGSMELIYDIPIGIRESQLPWKAEEYANYVDPALVVD